MKVLIIVDLQNDFLPQGSLPVPKGDAIIPYINEIQKEYPLVVATQDWHPREHESFASNHKDKKPFDQIVLHGLDQTLWPDHCVQGSEGAAFASALDMNRVEAIFRKGTNPKIDSYSAFYDNGHRKSTGLADYLRGKEVQEVFLTGLTNDICVFYTAMDSLKEGFKTTILKKGTMPLNEEENEKVMKEFVDYGGNIKN